MCSKCVRLVNNRIESMTYLARTENLKLALQKTKKGTSAYNGRTSWKRSLIFLGGCLWWTSVVGQLVWHLLGISLRNETHSYEGLPACLLDAALSRSSDIRCYRSVTGWVSTFLTCGVLSMWWNNKLSQTASGSGRLMNLNDYYFAQIVFFCVRLVAYLSMQQITAFPPERIHGAAIVFIIVFVISSVSIVKIKRRPMLSNYKLKQVEAMDSAPAMMLDDPAFKPEAEPQMSRKPFPISAMAPSTIPANSVFDNKSRRRPSDSTDVSSVLDRNWLGNEQTIDDGSEMDWTPTGPAFAPRQLRSMAAVDSSYTPAGSPFKYSLPPAPQHPMHKARKPAIQPTFYRASEQKRTEFAETLSGRQAEKPSVFDSWGLPAEPASAQEMDMGKPKLTLTQQETGLENIFNSVFSLQDEPQENRTGEVLQSVQAKQRQNRFWISATVSSLAIAIPLAICGGWLLAQRRDPVTQVEPELTWQ